MLHEADFYTWTQEQAALMRQGRLTELDLVNLVEELEDMGRSEKRELESRLSVLLAHLLKWQYQQPARRGIRWQATIEEQRFQVKKCLRHNPGLKSSLLDILEDAYNGSHFIIAKETGLKKSTFPDACPWSQEQILDDDFWPGSPPILR